MQFKQVFSIITYLPLAFLGFSLLLYFAEQDLEQKLLELWFIWEFVLVTITEQLVQAISVVPRFLRSTVGLKSAAIKASVQARYRFPSYGLAGVPPSHPLI